MVNEVTVGLIMQNIRKVTNYPEMEYDAIENAIRAVLRITETKKE